jgi:DNA topoisomerase-2
VARAVFPEVDDALLRARDDDGMAVEPVWYAPVLPLLLVNGAEGIGTGWSTSVPGHNPLDVIDALLHMLHAHCARAGGGGGCGGDAEEAGGGGGVGTGEQWGAPHIAPWFRGFRGEVSHKSAAEMYSRDAMDLHAEAGVEWDKSTFSTAFSTSGIVTREAPNRLRVRELPVGRWSQDFKDAMTKQLLVPKSITGVQEGPEHSENAVDFLLTAPRAELDRWGGLQGGVEKQLRLRANINLTNMHAFDPAGRIRRYRSAADVLDCFFPVRLELYVQRKERQLVGLAAQAVRLDNRARFVREVSGGELALVVGGAGGGAGAGKFQPRKKSELEAALWQRGYAMEGETEAEVEERDAATAIAGAGVDGTQAKGRGGGGPQGPRVGGYDYLLRMPILSFTEERVTSLLEQVRCVLHVAL